MPSKWIEHIKDFAKKNSMTYKDALKDPKCKEAYATGKGLGGSISEAKEEPKNNIEMKIEEIKKGRGRPKKYATPEEAKKAKSMKTMESNKRKKAEKGKSDSSSDSGSDMEGGAVRKPIGMPNPLADPKFKKKYMEMKEAEGKGLNVGYKTENTNGLGHIYPISHEAILQMLSCCPKK